MKNSAVDEASSATLGPSPRRLTLKGAMALIAATAVGLALVRYSQLRYFAWQEPANPDKLVYHTLLRIGYVLYGSLPVLYTLCAVVVLAGLRGTRPCRQEFSVRPGLAACTATLVASLAACVFRWLNYAVGSSPGVLWSKHPFDVLIATAPDQFWSPKAVDVIFMSAGQAAMPAILAVWMLQRLCGLWKPIREWPDRLGRALGCIFLLWMLTPH
jgi:hypothetical protein